MKAIVTIFILLSLIVFYLQYDLLQPTLEIGFTPDDWGFVFWYKSLGPNPLSKIAEVWRERGPYTTVPLYYTGIIHSIVGFDYLKLQIVGILFKILATLALFPLILVVFKNRVLAAFTTILFAMSYSSAGPLETAVEPSEYLGMFSMGLFLIVYHYVIKKQIFTWKWLMLLTLMFIITILLSVMRLFPLLFLVPAIEIYLWIQRPSKKALKTALLRLIFLFSPFLLITLYRPNVILNYIGTVPSVLLKVFEGNWHPVLVPLQGIGYTFPFSAHWKLFGLASLESFKDYLSFVIVGPTMVFSLVILLLALVTSTKPWKFFILAFCLNFTLEILVFFIATHGVNFDPPRMYSTLFGLFILVLAVVYWVEWQFQDKRDNLLLAIWVGPSIAFLFVFLTWILADINLGFGGAQNHYLMIPTASISLFMAALLTLTYKKVKVMKSVWFKGINMLLILTVLIGFYLLNKDLIYSYFNSANANGRAASGQILIQTRFKEKIRDFNLSKSTLFYFDTSEISQDSPFYTEGLLSSLPFFMHFEGNNLIDGCVEVFYENRDKLKQLIKIKDGEKGFFYRSLCVDNGKGGYKDIFYKSENFYAFKLKNRDFIDIKEEVLNDLEFNN